MANKLQFDSERVLDPELAKFAEQDSADKASVIVELSFESPQVELAESRGDEDLSRPFAALPIDEQVERQRMDRLESELESLGIGQMVRLDTAQAFVVEVTPAQLRAITLLAETGLVRPNRTHHV